MRTRTLIATTLAAALAGCGACDTVPSDAIEDCETSVVLPGSVKTDILFVIDDSGSMLDEQLQVRNALGRFVGRLAASPIANDFQIGVTNTSVRGFGQNALSYTAGPSAGTPYPRGALVAVAAPTVGELIYSTAGVDPGFGGTQIMTWDSESLTTDFRNNVLLGIDGSGREMPFEAARLALSDRLADENAGFVRPGARLAIVFITDEDDCSGPYDSSIGTSSACATARSSPTSSLTAVSDFAAFLRGPIAGESRDVVVAAITGVTCSGGTCTNVACNADIGMTPDRVLALLQAMPPARTRLASICDANFDQALDAFAEAILSQTLPLDGAVADYRMLAVRVAKADGRVVSCPIASDAEPLTSTVGAFYEPPRSGIPPSLTFVNECALSTGDSVDVNVLCFR